MPVRVLLTPQAEEDLDDLARAIARDNLAAALRLYEAADATFDLLAEQPGIGGSAGIVGVRVPGLLRKQILGFKRYALFYRRTPDGVEILRILYGGRNLPEILEGKEGD